MFRWITAFTSATCSAGLISRNSVPAAAAGAWGWPADTYPPAAGRRRALPSRGLPV